MKVNLNKTTREFDSKRTMEEFVDKNHLALHKSVESAYEDQPHRLQSLYDGDVELIQERANENKDYIRDVMTECYYDTLMVDDIATEWEREVLFAMN